MRGLRLAVAMAALGLTAGCAPAPVDVPSELLGRWMTTDPGMVGRAMVFTLDGLTIETGEAPPTRHAVVAVEAQPRDSGPWELVVVYEGEGGNEYRLSLLYDDASRHLRLRNRSEVLWTQEEGP